MAFGLAFLLQSTFPFSLGMWLPAVILCQPYVEVCSDAYFSNYLFAFHSPLHRFLASFYLFLLFSCVHFRQSCFDHQSINQYWYTVGILSFVGKISYKWLTFKSHKCKHWVFSLTWILGEEMNIKLSRRLLKVWERRYGRMTGVGLLKAHSLTPGNAIENETNFVVQLIHFFKKRQK